MFSGIRYILGYTDDAPAPAASDAASSGTEQHTIAGSSTSKSETTSTTVLEQTLNAATTKFTEQLLPQQASIEQLQSSSHQLLPSITEQHEEDELKKSSVIVEQVLAVGNEDEEDDINVDSWELLDLVDKVEDVAALSSPMTSSVQKDESSALHGLSRSTSGILKSSGGKSNDNDNNLQMRQKQRVSFETPDLVKFKQEIEQTKAKEEEERKLAVSVATLELLQSHGKVIIPRGGKGRKARGLQAQMAHIARNNENSSKLKVEVKDVVEEEVCEAKEVTEVKSSNPSEIGHDVKEQPLVCELKSSATKKVPVLNYAKALSAKPKAKTIEKVSKGSEAGLVVAQCSSSKVETSESNGPIKRSRPLSTSSWSSSDEIEAMERTNATATVETQSSAMASSSVENNAAQDMMDDNESLISSGFSDCDYGFSGLNDYIMRPKKVYHKRGQGSSGSSSSLVGMKSRRSDGTSESGKPSRLRNTGSKLTKPVATDTKETLPQQTLASSSSKNTKPKKRRMIMTTSKNVSPSEFLKQQKRSEPKSKVEGKQVAAAEAAARNGSGESSDITDMDESWFVTPPPCFTGASRAARSSKVDQPKAKEAARENALIEHPSIYIASTSRDSLKVKFTAKSNETTNKKSLAEAPPKSSQVVDKVAAALEDSAWASDDDLSDISDSLSLDTPADEIARDDVQEVQPTDSFDEIKHPENEELSANVSVEQEVSSCENDLSAECSAVDVKTSAVANKRRGVENVRPPTQVRPIEPERRPGWQLKRQRSKRRSPLKVAGGTSGKQQVASEPRPSPVMGNSANSSLASSSRSTPTLIDRIGTSIVANLTNLTNGLVTNGAINYCSNGRHPSIMDANPERAHQGPLSNRTNSGANLGQLDRKQMSRGSLKRQNDCAKQGNSLRRPDRRLKMFATPNGCSVNRKVHTSIH